MTKNTAPMPAYFEEYAQELQARIDTLRTNVENGFGLYWVQEPTEIYAARSSTEARQFVELLSGEPVQEDEVGVIRKNKVGSDDEGNPITLFETFSDIEFTGPEQLWTQYQ